MSRHRKRPDGLPHRVYERFGTRTYSIGYKGPDGTWRFRFKCSVTDAIAIARLRLAATLRARGIAHNRLHSDASRSGTPTSSNTVVADDCGMELGHRLNRLSRPRRGVSLGPLERP